MAYHDETLAHQVYSRTFRPGLTLTVSNTIWQSSDEVRFEMQPMIYYGVIVEGSASELSIGRSPLTAIDPGEPVMLMVREPAEFVGRLCEGVRYLSLGLTIETAFMEELSENYRTDIFIDLMRHGPDRAQVQRLPRRPVVNDIVREMLAPASGSAVTNLRMEACALTLVADIAHCLRADRFGPCPRGMRQIEKLRSHRVRDHIDAHLDQPLTLAALSREAGVNPTTMSAQFKACFGTSIFGYLRLKRMETARDLLRGGSGNVAQIGYRVGFESPAAFANAYRRHFGHPPSHETR